MAIKQWQIRLPRELKVMSQEPLEGIKFHVHEDKMHKMCLILSLMSGPLRGVNLHLTVDVVDYPWNPPRVTVDTPVPHPNLFPHYLCCSILNISGTRYFNEERRTDSYTPAYRLDYLFLQLLSFFNSEKVDQEDGPPVNYHEYLKGSFTKEHRDALSRFTCEKCGYNIRFPALTDGLKSDVKKPESASFQGTSGADSADIFDLLNDDSRASVMKCLSLEDTLSVTKACPAMKETAERFETVLEKEREQLRREVIKCFVLWTSLEDVVSPKDILGIGVSMDKRKPYITVIDLLSLEAFMGGRREGAIPGTRFEHLLPVVLTDHHYALAKPYLLESIQNLNKLSDGIKLHIGGALGVTQTAVARVIPALMNSLVFHLVNSCDEAYQNKTAIEEKASEKALQGYCLLFHVFSKLVRDFTSLQEWIRGRIDSFLADKKNRSKEHVPDLGEFLTYILVSNVSVDSDTFCEAFVEELLARNVTHFLDDAMDRDYQRDMEKAKLAFLAYMEPDDFPSEFRLTKTFEVSRKGLRLVMFQMNFFRMTWSQQAQFDARYGYPSTEMCRGLFGMIKKIYAVEDWSLFLRMVGYKFEERGWKWHVMRMLKDAIKLSEEKGYHVVRYTEAELYEKRRRVEKEVEKLAPPKGWHPGLLPREGLGFFPNNPNRGNNPSYNNYNRGYGYNRRW